MLPSSTVSLVLYVTKVRWFPVFICYFRHVPGPVSLMHYLTSVCCTIGLMLFMRCDSEFFCEPNHCVTQVCCTFGLMLPMRYDSSSVSQVLRYHRTMLDRSAGPLGLMLPMRYDSQLFCEPGPTLPMYYVTRVCCTLGLMLPMR